MQHLQSYLNCPVKQCVNCYIIIILQTGVNHGYYRTKKRKDDVVITAGVYSYL